MLLVNLGCKDEYEFVKFNRISVEKMEQKQMEKRLKIKDFGQ